MIFASNFYVPSSSFCNFSFNAIGIYTGLQLFMRNHLRRSFKYFSWKIKISPFVCRTWMQIKSFVMLYHILLSFPFWILLPFFGQYQCKSNHQLISRQSKYFVYLFFWHIKKAYLDFVGIHFARSMDQFCYFRILVLALIHIVSFLTAKLCFLLLWGLKLCFLFF